MGFEIILVLSNFMISPTIMYLLKNYMKYYIELLTFGLILLTSSIYHACFILDCEEYYGILWKWDRILALQTITSCILYLIDREILKKLSWCLNLIMNICVVYLDPNNLYSILASSCVINLSVIFYHYKVSSFKLAIEFVRNRINTKYVFLTLFLIQLGIIFFHLANTDLEHYTIYHSLWHIFIFSTTYTSLFIKKEFRIERYNLVREISMENFANLHDKSI